MTQWQKGWEMKSASSATSMHLSDLIHTLVLGLLPSGLTLAADDADATADDDV